MVVKLDECFAQVGIRPDAALPVAKAKRYQDKPVVSTAVFLAVAAGCLASGLFLTKDPAYMDLYHADTAPCKEFLFGTDRMGRDIFAMVWYGGRISLTVGFLAALISTAVAILVGTASGLSSGWPDFLLMRFTDIVLSIPNLLLVILIQAVLGKANVFSIALVIGITGWTSIAKVVRTEVRQLRDSEYVTASRCMGAGFFWMMRKHFVPNLLSSIMFMVVMNIRGAIVCESTLSFLGMGLPLEAVSWGSMLSLADQSLLSGSWWVIVIPGFFLATTLLCITDLGNYVRKSANLKRSNL